VVAIKLKNDMAIKKKITKKPLVKAQKGKEIKPDYSNIKGKGWDYFKTPTAKDSADYRQGFYKKVKGEQLKQFPSPSGAEIRGYNEATKRKLKTGGAIKTKALVYKTKK
jgi:hypothetical protein